MQVCRTRDFQSSEIKWNFVNAIIGGEREVWMKRWPKDPQPRRGDVSMHEAGRVTLEEGHQGASGAARLQEKTITKGDKTESNWAVGSRETVGLLCCLLICTPI